MDEKDMEEWRSLESLGYPGYEVSSHGRVLGIRGRFLSLKPNEYGYVCVSLCVNGHKESFSVHQLVARMFIGSPKEGETVDHIDQNRSNNHFRNLRWATKSEQGLNRAPSKTNGHRKPVRQSTLNRELVRIWNSVTEAAEETKYSQPSISIAIKNKKPYQGFLWEFVSNEIEGEIWEEFTFPGSKTHWASNFGRIRRPVVKGSNAHEITAGSLSGVYKTINIHNEGLPKNMYVHVLVAFAFHGPKPEGYVVNHEDGNKTNNRPDNLKYVTPSENIQHAHDIGLFKNNGSSIPIQQCSLEGEHIPNYKSISAAAVKAMEEFRLLQ